MARLKACHDTRIRALEVSPLAELAERSGWGGGTLGGRLSWSRFGVSPSGGFSTDFLGLSAVGKLPTSRLFHMRIQRPYLGATKFNRKGVAAAFFSEPHICQSTF